MSEESKSVYMSYIEIVRISLDAAQRIGCDIELHRGGLIKLFKEIDALNARIAELEAENNRLAELLHNELSSVEIATDLGNKRWVALNDIYENGEKHNTNWCKRIAQKGLGIK